MPAAVLLIAAGRPHPPVYADKPGRGLNQPIDVRCGFAASTQLARSLDRKLKVAEAEADRAATVAAQAMDRLILCARRNPRVPAVCRRARAAADRTRAAWEALAERQKRLLRQRTDLPVCGYEPLPVQPHSAVPASDAAWRAALRPPCPRCVPSGDLIAEIPAPTPERAIVFFSIGEFATRVEFTIIDLDAGRLTLVSRNPEGPTTDVSRTALIKRDALDNLRIASVRAWRRPPGRIVRFAPGATLEMDVVSGDQAAHFDPDDPQLAYLRTAIDRVVDARPTH